MAFIYYNETFVPNFVKMLKLTILKGITKHSRVKIRIRITSVLHILHTKIKPNLKFHLVPIS